ncbi:MAG TPA: S41 family peptidase [Chitinophagaceae bacterium]|nr:S41 family peptidase [Chitinophagaceae bacterium]
MEYNKKYRVFFPLLFSLVLALGMYFGFKLRDMAGNHYRVFFHGIPGGTLQEVMDLVALKYVDSVKKSTLRKDAINGILNHLDPHSIYITPSQLQQVNNDLEGNFQGIGIEFSMFSDTVNITSVLPNGPAETAGLRMGDRIIRVNDSLVSGVHFGPRRVRNLMHASGGNPIELTILRKDRLRTIEINPGNVSVSPIDASYMIVPGMGYIRINRFSDNTYDEFMKAITALKAHGMRKLIIDLRGNPGGFLDAATHIADELLDDHKLIVYTQGKDFPRTNYYCTKPGLFEKGKLAILVDEGSASASEILAGAIQDWDRGLIIGRRTFGKGLVQEQYPLEDGGALRLTVARYYIPSGRCIQKPYNHGFAAYDEDIINRFNHGEFLNADSIRINDTTRYRTLVKGRIVYGGGGITPDIFVPFDTTRVDRLMSDIYSRSILEDFTYHYFNRHPSIFSEFTSPGNFSRHFEISPGLMQDFTRFAIADSITAIRSMNKKESAIIGDRMKSFFARDIWRNEGYFVVANSYDPVVQRAIHALGD